MTRAALFFALVPAALAADTCIECHSALAGNLQKPAALFSADIHGNQGFSCADCHGGDRTASDMEAAMSPAKGFRGHIARTAIPQLCARCHSDAALMRRYNPRQRVDQYAQYLTSVHGKRIASGDPAAATCIDCHSVHDIRTVRDALSPVHPLRLPDTCGRCHADAARMAKYKIATNQLAEYRESVHWEALSKRGDLSAPSCASCHGNHGATPPQVAAVANVCGTCHAMLEDVFRTSPHQTPFASLGGCVVCHSNHAVRQPSAAMLAGSEAVCANCHDPESPGGKSAAAMAAAIQRLDSTLAASDALLARARRSGMEVSEALLREHDAREAFVKTRVAVHTFRAVAVEKAAGEGLAIAAETRRAGEDALKERDYRRLGLLAALAAIAVTIAGLWMMVRSMERAKPPAAEVSKR